MSAIVAEGQRLLDAQAAAERELAQINQLAATLVEAQHISPAIIELLNTVLARLGALEVQTAQNRDLMIATRVRRPVRDELGTILYVIDELQPPAWAMPITPA